MRKLALDSFIACAVAVPVFLSDALGGGTSLSARAVLSFLVFAPVAEELVFRGIIQKYLMFKMKCVYALILTSVLFALTHLVFGNIYSLLVFFPSLVLGWHYARNGSLAAVMLIHAFYNVNVFL